MVGRAGTRRNDDGARDAQHFCSFVTREIAAGRGCARCFAPRSLGRPLAVEVTNASEPVLCAEKDNVTLNLASKRRAPVPHRGGASRLYRHAPARQLRGRLDRLHMPGDPTSRRAAAAQAHDLYEEIDFWVVGLTFADFWRPSTATVRIGDRVEKDMHLLQVWMIRPMGGEEVLVLYPQDGYWRAAADGAGRHGADRVRLVVPDRPGGGRRAADREHQGDRLRSESTDVHAHIRARRLGDGGDGQDRSEPATSWTSPSTRRSTAARSPRCAPCT